MRYNIARTRARRTVILRRLSAILIASVLTTTAACDKLLSVAPKLLK